MIEVGRQEDCQPEHATTLVCRVSLACCTPTRSAMLSAVYPTPIRSSDQDVIRWHPTATKMTRAQQLTALRDQLPIHEYLNMLHTLAMTGRMPIYRPGKTPNDPPEFTGEYTEPDTKAQQQMLQYLVEKAFSGIPKQVNIEVNHTQRVLEAGAANRLSMSELLEVLKDTASD